MSNNGSRDPAKRQLIEDAVVAIEQGRSTQVNYDVLVDRELMYHATGDQMCRVIRAAMKRTIPPDVTWAAAITLVVRWEQSPARRRKTEPAPRTPAGTPTFRKPAGW